ncbi:MAG TPA: hypothetical protein VEW70_14090, partial [Burkholderiales bacterium]|nr:hypothetical protein [Burkholderiales bacterium]
MKRQQQLLRAAPLAGALSCAAIAQDNRYPGADDAARQTAPPPVQVQPAPVQQQVPPAAVAPAPPSCATCGTVDSIRITERTGEGS